MPASDVTAVIATYNRERFLVEALDSVLGQTVPPDQVIVIDDGSTDGTDAILRGYGNRIEVIAQENGGKSRALNRAMPQVRGHYTWIFDDDDVALPWNLERHLAMFEANPGTGFVYSGYSVLRSFRNSPDEHKGYIKLPRVPDDEIFTRMLEENFMQQQGMLVRTSCYGKVGPFDPQLDRGQDYEMNLRLARHFPGRRLDAPSFLFRQHDGRRGRPGTEIPANQRSRTWIRGNRALLRRLRDELALAEYLPRSLAAGQLDEPRRRRALLQRACVMARCALWEEALADLDGALVDTMPGVRLGEAELDLCRRALSKYIRNDVAIEALLDDPFLARRFRRLLDNARNGPVRRIFANELARYVRATQGKGTPARVARARTLACSILKPL